LDDLVYRLVSNNNSVSVPRAQRAMPFGLYARFTPSTFPMNRSHIDSAPETNCLHSPMPPQPSESLFVFLPHADASTFSLGLALLAEKCVFSSYQALNRDVAQRAHRNAGVADVILLVSRLRDDRLLEAKEMARRCSRRIDQLAPPTRALVGIAKRGPSTPCPFLMKDYYYYIIRSFRLL